MDYGEPRIYPVTHKKGDDPGIHPNVMWDPNKIGPLSKCIQCFTETNEEKAFCLNCGRISLVFAAPPNCKKKYPYCSNHPRKSAVGWCGLHAKPICELCDSQGMKPSDYFDYTVNLNCSDCLDLSSKTKAKYLERLKERGYCSKHSSNKATTKCNKCKLPLCKNCAYSLKYEVKQNIFKNKAVNEGPYCLGCLRQNTHWVNRDKTASWSSLSPTIIV